MFFQRVVIINFDVRTGSAYMRLINAMATEIATMVPTNSTAVNISLFILYVFIYVRLIR